MMDEIRLIEGGTSVDDRGEVAFLNEVDLGRVRRLYTITNHAPGSVRAWHAHRREGKFVAAVQGAAVVAAVRIDDWDQPSKDATVERFVLSSRNPALLYIPAGFANGSMTLTADTKLIYFSTATIEESRADDIRFDARYWDPWQVEDR